MWLHNTTHSRQSAPQRLRRRNLLPGLQVPLTIEPRAILQVAGLDPYCLLVLLGDLSALLATFRKVLRSLGRRGVPLTEDSRVWEERHRVRAVA